MFSLSYVFFGFKNDRYKDNELYFKYKKII